MLAIRLPPEIEARLETLAKKTGRSKSYYVREALVEHLGDLEDVYLADKRLAAARKGKSKAVTLEDLLKRHGMAD
jgi:RHH-type rel operon transcriptional repressor/antitoxin RelB